MGVVDVVGVVAGMSVGSGRGADWSGPVTRCGVANHVSARLRKRGKRDCRLSTPRWGREANHLSVVAPAGLTGGDSTLALLILGEIVARHRP
jgi:hypothetical protein